MRRLSSALALSIVATTACGELPLTGPTKVPDQGTVTTAHATAPVRPYGGHCETTFVILPAQPGDPPNLQRLHIDGICQLRHLGRTAVSAEQTVTFGPTGTAIAATIIYVAANGDRLFSAFSGTGTLPDQNFMVTFTGTETFAGGTGRFVSATGWASTSGSASLLTSTGQLDASGTLSY